MRPTRRLEPRRSMSRSARVRAVRRAGLAAALAVALAPFAAPAQDAAPGTDELGTLCFADGSAKRLEPDDALWAARMIHGETGGDPTADESAAMLWAMAQRSYWSPTWRPRGYGELLLAYSQPINPRWTRTGRHCRKYHADDWEGEVPDRCSESRVRRREQYRALAWPAIDATARDAVRAFGAGRLANPVVGAVGWWAQSFWDRRERSGANAADHQSFHSTIERNAYFYASGPGAALDTRGWSGGEVVVAAPGSACPARE